MSEQRGVPLEDLHCPTCSARFKSGLHRDNEPPMVRLDKPRGFMVSNEWPPYVLCEQGHAWTVKLIIRREDSATEVLLDCYVGERP